MSQNGPHHLENRPCSIQQFYSRSRGLMLSYFHQDATLVGMSTVVFANLIDLDL
jgi:hypothetical protein